MADAAFVFPQRDRCEMVRREDRRVSVEPSALARFQRVFSASVRLTDLSLSCAARARMPKPRGTLVAAYTAGQRRANCNQRDAATLGIGRGALAPDRSRAASAARASQAAGAGGLFSAADINGREATRVCAASYT